MKPAILAAILLASSLSGCTAMSEWLAGDLDDDASGPSPSVVPILAIGNEHGQTVRVTIQVVTASGVHSTQVYTATDEPDVVTPEAALDPQCDDTMERLDLSVHDMNGQLIASGNAPAGCSGEEWFILVDNDGTPLAKPWSRPPNWQRGDPWPYR